MKSVETHLKQYGAYHRDKRNVLTHCFGIPLIVFAVAVLLSRPAVDLGSLTLSPALVAVVLLTIYYVRLDIRLGATLSVFLWLCLALGHGAAQWSTSAWLLLGAGSFVVGWALQFLGHHWEGRKPAFIDDVMGLLIGPLFIVAEAAFALGLLKTLRAKVFA
jgi:uncharacterized membrane protein YGL010W